MGEGERKERFIVWVVVLGIQVLESDRPVLVIFIVTLRKSLNHFDFET